MQKAQTLKFWEALHDSSSEKETVASFKNKPGYESKRTLQRYARADAMFKNGLSLLEVAKKTGWGIEFVKKIHGWWKSKFSAETPTTSDIATNVTNLPSTSILQNENESAKCPQNNDMPKPSDLICLASPDNIDVRLLRSWGISGRIAPDILHKWCSCHRDGNHEKCKIFHHMIEDLVSGIPYKIAKELFDYEEACQLPEMHELYELVVRYRKFRGWENRQNHLAFIKEAKDLLKQLKHQGNQE